MNPKSPKIDVSQKILKAQGPRVEWVGHSWPMLSESKWQLEQTPHTYDEKTRVTVKTLNMMKVMKTWCWKVAPWRLQTGLRTRSRAQHIFQVQG